MNKILTKILCFVGLHNYETRTVQVFSTAIKIEKKCKNCNKVVNVTQKRRP